MLFWLKKNILNESYSIFINVIGITISVNDLQSSKVCGFIEIIVGSKFNLFNGEQLF